MMEFWFSAETLTTLFSIILIDLVLAGDNAIVIGLAARNVKKDLQKKAILFGTLGAIAIRIVATVLVVQILKIPGLLLIGGLLLVWIAYKLLAEKKGHEIEAKNNMVAAIRTIIIADAAMGMDNVIAIAGASHGHTGLVIIGLLVSVPIIVWGSTLFIRVVERFPIVIYAGSAVLAYTAGKMIAEEKLFHDFFAANPEMKWTLIGVIVVLVLVVGKLSRTVGHSVKVNALGQIVLPKHIGLEADILPEDQFTVRMDGEGRFVLVKIEDTDDPDKLSSPHHVAQHA
ncbi:integral membrane protein, YjbE family [Paenibacillus larvae subsp. larvae DSM 25430]|nr:TerC family protein [Paenibacillus larvae]AVG11545.1 integral membrane protein, YjbE family [Paenibacillus larvae subsp. larvae DSM 25430]QHZ50404.1 integral membrane protein, YjbE family [Paenibacillus larvae subsp. larvae]